VDTGERDQVGLELVQVDVQGTIEPQRGGDGRDDLGDKTVEVLVAWPGNVQIPAADVEHGFVVNQEGAVRVLDGAVGGEDGVVGLNHGRRQAGRWVHGELELALLAVVGREALEEQSAEAGTGAAAEGVEDQEALQGVAVVCQAPLDMRRLLSIGPKMWLTSNTADAVNDPVDHLLANGVVATGIVVGGILLAADQILGVEKLAVVASADLIDRGGVEINEDGPGDVFPVVGLGEEGVV
jgi:hypothetical protein